MGSVIIENNKCCARTRQEQAQNEKRENTENEKRAESPTNRENSEK